MEINEKKRPPSIDEIIEVKFKELENAFADQFSSIQKQVGEVLNAFKDDFNEQLGIIDQGASKSSSTLFGMLTAHQLRLAALIEALCEVRVDGKPLLDPKRIEEIFTEHVQEAEESGQWKAHNMNSKGKKKPKGIKLIQS